MLAILVSLVAGLLVGAVLPDRPAVERALAVLTSVLIYAVVAAQGLNLGASEGFAQTWLDTVLHGGALSLCVLVCTVGTVELTTRAHGWLRPSRVAVEADQLPVGRAGFPWAVVLILGLLAISAVLGMLGQRLVAPVSHTLIWPLYALLVVIGLDLGRQRATLPRRLRHARSAAWIVPVMLGGSALGGLLATLLLPYTAASMVAGGVASSFYSVAGPMVSQLDAPAAGGVVFMANVLRETAAMVLVPLFPRLGLSLPAGASVGAACAMDSGLPFLVRAWGSQGAVTGLAVGLVASLLVPLLIPFVYVVVG